MTKKDEGKQDTGVVKWEEMMKQEAKDVAKTERPSVGRISLQSGIMTYQDQAVPDNTLNCIVAHAIQENVVYQGAFRPGVVNPPLCYAYGVPGNELRAHEDVPERDWKGWGDCTICAYAQWGSGIRDGQPTRGKRCGERRKLAILPILETPDEYKSAEIAVLSVPVMSVANWSNYVNQIAAEYQRPSWGLLTQIKVVPDAKSQFRVLFSTAGTLADEFMGAVYGRLEMCVSTLNVPYDMSPGKEQDEEEEGEKKY